MRPMLFIGLAYLLLGVDKALPMLHLTNASAVIEERVCIGTNGRLSVPSNKQHHYRNLRDRYTNCTYVDGNLEITWLQSEDYDLSFLQYIREVTGYVLISHVDVKKMVLPRLQIIRGRTLFKLNNNIHKQEFALFVTMCQMFNLEMPALRDILNGSVGIYDNYNLCHVKTINWDEIISGPNSTFSFIYNFTSPERICPDCHESCPQGCWGEGAHNCQQFSKTNCSPQCWQGRCFGPNPRECCHLFCAGGCTGPKQSDCLACKTFYDDGVCTQECPPMQKYNPTTYSWEANPDGKYAYGATCVRKCPEHLLKDSGACVRSCPPNKKAQNGECVNCEGPCPKTCQGVSELHSGNIDSFKDCTIIEGSITILDQTFRGYQHFYSNFSFGSRYEPMHPDKLEVFSTLKEITGFLNIQGDHDDFRNLSYFRNLELIGGRTLTELFASLYIVKTSLVSLDLQSLKVINSGRVAIVENKELCYASTINWNRIIKSITHGSVLNNNKDDSLCLKEGLVCDVQCSEEGCWGPGTQQCLSCKNFILDNVCIKDCSSPGIYRADKKNCKRCHQECNGTCTGPNAEHCTSCKNVRDGPYCVPECPMSKYNDSGHCKPCHENCVGGCEGPENNIGPNGCHSCETAIMSGSHVPEGCLQKKAPCPPGHYFEWVNPQEQGALKPLAGKAICRKCHPHCQRCTGYGTHEQVCQVCSKYKRAEHCEEECPNDNYIDPGTNNCLPCDDQCRGCYGPGPTQCLNCRNLRVYPDGGTPQDNSTMFNCTETCPPEFPHKAYPLEGELYCSLQPSARSLSYDDTPFLLSFVIVVVAVIVVAIGIMVYQLRVRVKTKESQVKMTMQMTGYNDDDEPLRPTGLKPNLAKLRIIKEEELRKTKGGILGFGAFGNVYKGVWVPEGENTKIPVAIKVLHESTGVNRSKEFLDEAYIMASVEHPNLLQLLAVCMTSQMMLVTHLLPLGCLLDFVRNHKDKIGSKSFLTWCTQIARGMAYLEERRLVHRDLAARNVLVQNGNCIKITDFGLAKLLDINEEEYKAAGGKMPIKWLALECIQHRIFTHKSDVWAFGVTIWEVLTYGDRPYENVPARNVPELLEKGERLPQPTICTIDVYMIMVKCWMLDAESRPSFKDLAEEFFKMSRDPGRYLVIKGDKYMRLPQYMLKDEKELVHSPTSMEGSDNLETDEYLQPKCRAPLPAHLGTCSITDSLPSTPVKKTWPNGLVHSASDSPTPQNQQNLNRELLRLNGPNGPNSTSHDGSSLHSMPSYTQPNSVYSEHQVSNSDSSVSRYCVNPIKIFSKECDVTDDGYTSEKMSQKNQMELNDEEEDYLTPSPQISLSKTHYMDLIADAVPIDSKQIVNGYHKYRPGFLPASTKMSLDNPEYIMSPDSPLTPQSVGIPEMNVASNIDFACRRQKSSDEGSDHEYYNDFDRIDRELQPLKPFNKNETTV